MRKIASIVVAAVAAFSSCTDEQDAPLAAFAETALRDRDVAPAIPILRVDNLRASQRYWRDVLGFEVKWEDGEPPDFCEVKRGDASFFMCQRCQGNAGSWSFVFVKDVDKLHKEIAAKRAIILRPPTNEPWKLREMHVADPDGNVVRFASPTKH